jgi:hypothetical protein
MADTDTYQSAAGNKCFTVASNLCNCQHLWLVDMKVECLRFGHRVQSGDILRGGAMVTCLCVLQLVHIMAGRQLHPVAIIIGVVAEIVLLHKLTSTPAASWRKHQPPMIRKEYLSFGIQYSYTSGYPCGHRPRISRRGEETRQSSPISLAQIILAIPVASYAPA